MVFFCSSAHIATQIFEKYKDDDVLVDLIRQCVQKAKISMPNLLARPNGRLKYYQKHFSSIADTLDPDSEAELHNMYRTIVDLFRAAQEDGDRSAILKKARDRVAKIQKQLVFHKKGPDNLNLITPTRYHICDGKFKKKYSSRGHAKSSKEYWFFLFNDLLLYTTLPDKKNKMEPKYALHLLGAYIEDADRGVSKTNLAISIKSPIKEITIKCKNQQEKATWQQHLTKTIKALSETNGRAKKSKAKGKRGW